MMNNKEKYKEFYRIIARYCLTDTFIKNKKDSFLKLMLTWNIDIYEAFDAFLKYETEIDKAIIDYHTINKILGSLNKEELYIIKAYVIKNKTCEEVSNYLGLSQRTFFRRYSDLVSKFMRRRARERESIYDVPKI